MVTPVLIGLGSNLGDRKAHLDFAVAALSKTPGVTVRAVSSYHETAAVGGPGGQSAFLNAAAALETSLEPGPLLDRLNAVEGDAGRVRTVRWGERTLDLDMLLYGDHVIDTPRLRIPHPRMALRRFVLSPLAEVAPGVTDPLTGKSIAMLLANLDRRPSYVAIFRHRMDERPIFRRLVASLPAVGLSRGQDAGTGDRVAYDSPLAGRLTPYLRLLEQTAAELRRDRWAEALWGDRWVVTDFWFDRIHGLAKHELSPTDFSMFHDRFLELRATVIEPTFLVLQTESTVTTMRETPDLNLPDDIGWNVPTLRPEGDDPEALASDILAACAATRAG